MIRRSLHPLPISFITKWRIIAGILKESPKRTFRCDSLGDTVRRVRNPTEEELSARQSTRVSVILLLFLVDRVLDDSFQRVAFAGPRIGVSRLVIS